MAARVVRVERDDHVGLGERALGGLLVARLPVVDAVVGLALLVVADQRRAVLERLLRVVTAGQRVVVDVDQLERVVGDVGVLGDTAATSWPWKRTLSVASTACVSPESVGIQARLCCGEQLAR